MRCDSCTYINAIGTRICDACGRSLGLPLVSFNNSGIQCPRCTLSNSEDSENCSVCEMPLMKKPKANVVTVIFIDECLNWYLMFIVY